MNKSYLEILTESENLSAAAVGADRETVRADFDTALAAFVVECKGVRDGSAT